MRSSRTGDPATASYLRSRSQHENFPVALRVLPAQPRRDLLHIYDVARVIDDLGDDAPGDRVVALTEFRADLRTIWRGGSPQAPVLRALAATVDACGLPEQPFLDLIEANLREQSTVVIESYAQLLASCELSANPIGQLVLHVFAASTPERVALSNQVCTALQIIEHCQDVGEDYQRGHVYLPLADLARFEVRPGDLGAATTSPALRRVIRLEVERAESMLATGGALVAQLRGWARLAVAGYLAGGRAAASALRRGDWSVLPTALPRRRRDVLTALPALLLHPGGVR